MKLAIWARRGLSWVVCLGSAGLFSACGGGSDGGGSGAGISESTATSYEGIYELTLRTENTNGCDAGGDDLLAESDPNFIMLGMTVLGSRLVQLTSCKGVDDCRQVADALRNMQGVPVDYSVTLSEEVDVDELTGFSAWTGFNEDGVCVERKYDEHALVRMGDTIRLETTTKGLADKPAENDICWARPAEDQKEAESAPCVSASALEGLRVADL